MRPNAIVVCMLLAVSAAGCRGKVTAVSTSLRSSATLVRADSLQRSLSLEAGTDSVSEIAAIEFLPPDSTGRQGLRRVVTLRFARRSDVRATTRERSATHTVRHDSVTEATSRQQTVSDARLPLSTHIAGIVCVILFILTILKLKKQS